MHPIAQQTVLSPPQRLSTSTQFSWEPHKFSRWVSHFYSYMEVKLQHHSFLNSRCSILNSIFFSGSLQVFFFCTINFDCVIVKWLGFLESLLVWMPRNWEKIKENQYPKLDFQFQLWIHFPFLFFLKDCKCVVYCLIGSIKVLCSYNGSSCVEFFIVFAVGRVNWFVHEKR
jgi:hypothetical protein